MCIGDFVSTGNPSFQFALSRDNHKSLEAHRTHSTYICTYESGGVQLNKTFEHDQMNHVVALISISSQTYLNEFLHFLFSSDRLRR